jgi:hypothetical protein
LSEFTPIDGGGKHFLEKSYWPAYTQVFHRKKWPKKGLPDEKKTTDFAGFTDKICAKSICPTSRILSHIHFPTVKQDDDFIPGKIESIESAARPA